MFNQTIGDFVRNPKETMAREKSFPLLEDGSDTWPAEDVYAFLEGDGWRWDGDHWVVRNNVGLPLPVPPEV